MEKERKDEELRMAAQQAKAVEEALQVSLTSDYKEIEKNEHFDIVALHDVYMTDLTRMGCVTMFKEPALHRLPTRSYYKGLIYMENKSYIAEFVRYESGNALVRNIKGSDSHLSDFFNKLNDYQGSRRIALSIRQLATYLFIIATPFTSIGLFYSLYYRNFAAAGYSLLFMIFCRLFHSITRNRL